MSRNPSPCRLIRVCSTVILPAAAVIAASSAALAGDWNTGTGGNSARDGRSQYVGPSAPDILWEGSLSAIVSQQAVIDGDGIVNTADLLALLGAWGECPL